MTRMGRDVALERRLRATGCSTGLLARPPSKGHVNVASRGARSRRNEPLRQATNCDEHRSRWTAPDQATPYDGDQPGEAGPTGATRLSDEEPTRIVGWRRIRR